MATGIIIKGIKSTLKFLNNKNKQVNQLTQKGLTDAALFVQGEVKESIAGRRAEPTSVDTGRLLNSVDISIRKTDAKIFSKLPYAKFLEFGTTKINPRRHFNNSKNRSKSKITKLMQTQINKLSKQ